MERILIAVDDSPAALAAADVAIELVAATKATARIVHVVADGALATALSAGGVENLADRRERSGGGLLRHLAVKAEGAGIMAETALVLGEPAQCILAEARSWRADLIVVGRSAMAGAGRPYIGQETRRILEFAEQPVLVVPPHR